MRSHEASIAAPLWPLFLKELREMSAGRALWTMLLLLCPLIGVSFMQAADLYAEASAAAADSPILAAGLSPLDGILVPTFGSFYVGVTLLFPFVAIRALGNEKQTGALQLLVQLPYRPATLIATKLGAAQTMWLFAALPVLSALLIWLAHGGHIDPLEMSNLLLGHFLYGMLIASISLFATSISESASTAAIITLAVTIGSWVIDFTATGYSGLLGWLAQASLTQTLRPFEQGLLSVGRVTGVVCTILGFATLAVIWLPPGITVRTKFFRSAVCVAVVGILLGLTGFIRRAFDLAEDRRNSFSIADQRALATLNKPLTVTVRLSPEDPRYVDLQRNVLAKLERAMPDITIRVFARRRETATGEDAERYGEVDYIYGERSDMSRSTSVREILPLLYGLAGIAPPGSIATADYPGYPLILKGWLAPVWFFAVMPLLVVALWLWTRRPPILDPELQRVGGNP